MVTTHAPFLRLLGTSGRVFLGGADSNLWNVAYIYSREALLV